MKPELKQDSLESILSEYVSIQLDLESSTAEENPAKHGGEIKYNTKRLEKNNERLRVLVSGSGTGQD